MKHHLTELATILDTLALEKEFGGDEGALESALMAGFARHEQITIERIAELAETYVESMSEECNPENVGYIEALGWFADKIREAIPRSSRELPYVPEQGDVVQLSFTGELNGYRDHRAGEDVWEFQSTDGYAIELGGNEEVALLAISKIADGL
jgi:hypothetical protein